MTSNFPDLVSIIVPFFNEEKYIAECLDSLYKQTYCNLEILCVDNGSTDNSANIVQKASQRDARIQLLEAKGGFQGRARNKGLDVAQGAFISFCDADDTMHPEMIAILVKTMHKHSADMVRCGHTNLFADGTKVEVLPPAFLKPVKGRIQHPALKSVLLKDLPLLVTTLSKRSLFEKGNIRFPENFSGEDQTVKWLMIVNASRIALCYKPMYRYRRFLETSSSEQTDRRMLSIIDNYSKVGSYLFKQNLFEKYYNAFTLDRASNIRHSYHKIDQELRRECKVKMLKALAEEQKTGLTPRNIALDYHASWLIDELEIAPETLEALCKYVKSLKAPPIFKANLNDSQGCPASWSLFLYDLNRYARRWPDVCAKLLKKVPANIRYAKHPLLSTKIQFKHWLSLLR